MFFLFFFLFNHFRFSLLSLFSGFRFRLFSAAFALSSEKERLFFENRVFLGDGKKEKDQNVSDEQHFKACALCKLQWKGKIRMRISTFWTFLTSISVHKESKMIEISSSSINYLVFDMTFSHLT